MHQPAESAYCPVVQIINEDSEQYWSSRDMDSKSMLFFVVQDFVESCGLS